MFIKNVKNPFSPQLPDTSTIKYYLYNLHTFLHCFYINGEFCIYMNVTILPIAFYKHLMCCVSMYGCTPFFFWHFRTMATEQPF